MDADGAYSIALFGALAVGAASLAAAGMRRHRITVVLLFLATLLGVLSFTIHVTLGHGTTSAEPTSIGDFLANHKAYFVVVALIAMTLVLHVRRR